MQLRGYLERVITASQWAKDLIRQVFAISREDFHSKEPFDLVLLLKEVPKLLRAT
jgi:hypothetical protein